MNDANDGWWMEEEEDVPMMAQMMPQMPAQAQSFMMPMLMGAMMGMSCNNMAMPFTNAMPARKAQKKYRWVNHSDE